MSNVTLVIRHFADHEFLVRRFYAADPEFRVICEDYSDALRAREVWAEDQQRSEEYRQLVRELEDEILRYIDERQPAVR